MKQRYHNNEQKESQKYNVYTKGVNTIKEK